MPVESTVIQNLEVERDILIKRREMFEDDIARLREENEKLRNTIGWYQDRDTYSEGPPEEWGVR